MPLTISSRSSRGPWSPGGIASRSMRGSEATAPCSSPWSAKRQGGSSARVHESGIESMAVCLLNSFENPAHELMLKEIIEKEMPGVPVSISYHVLPQIKEYERTSTTVTNAYVKPLTGRYLSKLAGRLDSIGFKGKLFIMLSSGGVTSVETAAEFPVRIIESGPTAAVIAGQYYGKHFNISGNVLLRHGRHDGQVMPHPERASRASCRPSRWGASSGS